MKKIDRMYINGEFVPTHGQQIMNIENPANNNLIGQLVLGDEQDAIAAIKSARNAAAAFAQTTREQRMQYLQQLHDAVLERIQDLKTVTIDEYGATVQRAEWSNRYAAEIFLHFKNTLQDFQFESIVGKSTVVLEPVGVTAILTAWNSNAGSICVKLGAAIAAGCTTVIKPSEMSALQTQVLTEAFHKAGLPAGVINVINGRGDVLGPILSTHPDIDKITFTGSSAVGKIIAKSAADTMKRLTLELSGKSANIILDDADLNTAIPLAVQACFMNSGQACVAGTRLLVPEKFLPQVKALLLQTVQQIKVGDPNDATNNIGPLASAKQYDRIQHYIQTGISEGAELLIGGPGKPEGLTNGYFVKPTVFTNVTNNMTIAQEEIFGPVLSVITYQTEEEAINIANDSIFGLHAYISSSDNDRAMRVAAQLRSGRVSVNSIQHDPLAPFGGYKQSGIGREGGVYGLMEQLEIKAIMK